MLQAPPDVTQMLLRWSEGDDQALDRLLPLVYEQLRQMAHVRLRHERPGHTLNTTALVHEAYLELVDLDRAEWKDRAHFLAMASRVMRNVLVDYAYRRRTQKRGGGQQRVDLDEERLIPDADVEKMLALDEALKGLATAHPRPAQAIEQSYFGGLTNQETAEVLGVSRATVERDLRFARVWLARALGKDLDSR